MIGSLHFRASAFLKPTTAFLKHVVPRLQQGGGLSRLALSTVTQDYRQRPFLHPHLPTTPSPSQRKGCVHFLPNKSFSSTSNNNDGSDEVILHFPAGSTIHRLASAAKYNTLNFGTKIVINCTQHLSERDIEELLCHLNKKIQSLRTCLRYHNDELWVCEQREPKLDFKVVTGDPDDEMNKLINTKFNAMEEPLWRVRLKSCSPADPCPMPELRDKFPHQYTVMFTFFHGSNDGIVALMAIITFVKLIENLITGVPIDGDQLGKIVSHPREIEETVRRELEKDPQRIEHLRRELTDSHFHCLLAEAFEAPEVSHPKTEFMYGLLDVTTFDRFIKKCLNAGVTINSAFTCAINTALVELVREAGVVRDTYSVTSRHAVDERRYWKGSIRDLGCHVANMSHSIITPHNSRKIFWEYAKTFDVEFREKLRSKYHFQERIVRSMRFPKDFSYDAYYSSLSPMLCDYTFTNLYTNEFTVVGMYDHVQISDLRPYTTVDHSDYSGLHSMGCVRDRIYYDIAYSTARMTRDTVQKFHDAVVNVFEDLANQ
ncbi:uncharacterized protein [Panulirus ornatus]|uniref:uncharacterized protein n=1 Tax=Panulirus ornatus TaxID=150431 RepID=UPI003A8A92AE